MKLSTITPFLSVVDQLAEKDLGIAAAHGFRSAIDSRPDGEAVDQPLNRDLAVASEPLGLAYRHIVVVSGKVTEDNSAPSPRSFSMNAGVGHTDLPRNYAQNRECRLWHAPVVCLVAV